MGPVNKIGIERSILSSTSTGTNLKIGDSYVAKRIPREINGKASGICTCDISLLGRVITWSPMESTRYCVGYRESLSEGQGRLTARCAAHVRCGAVANWCVTRVISGV